MAATRKTLTAVDGGPTTSFADGAGFIRRLAIDMGLTSEQADDVFFLTFQQASSNLVPANRSRSAGPVGWCARRWSSAPSYAASPGNRDPAEHHAGRRRRRCRRDDWLGAGARPTQVVRDRCSVTALVEAARRGDRHAWQSLVDEYSGLLWAVTRQFRLCDADAADVAQTTWLRLLEHIDQINDKSRVGAWLATTARRECLRMVAQRKADRADRRGGRPGSARRRSTGSRCIIARCRTLYPRERRVVADASPVARHHDALERGPTGAVRRDFRNPASPDREHWTNETKVPATPTGPARRVTSNGGRMDVEVVAISQFPSGYD